MCVGNGYCCPVGESLCGKADCYNPKTEVCCASTSTHCEEGYDCVEGGNCCAAGKVLCGEDDCYNPKTEVCCASTSTHCEEGYVCVQGGNCCEAGKVLCGEDDCYNPKTEVCCASTSTHCEEGYACVEGGYCCPVGEVPCGTDGCYNPDTEVCCADTSSHCDKGFDCVEGGCCPTGLKPCGASKCYDPETEICCPGGGACLEAETCCGEECCESIATCGSDGFCTATSTKSESLATRTPTPTITTPKITITTTSNKCTSPTPPNAQSTTETITFAYNPNHSIVPKSGSSAGQSIPAPNGAVLENMCEGIRNYTGSTSQSMTLTYGGPACKPQNYKNKCPRSGGKRYCAAGVASYIASFYPTSQYPSGLPSWATAAITAAGDMQCDEFPFANSVEGGVANRGSVMCVPAADQSWQGRQISPYTNSGRIKIGDRYVVLIQGWNCATQAPDPKAGTKRAVVDGMWKRDAFSAGGVNLTGRKLLSSLSLTLFFIPVYGMLS